MGMISSGDFAQCKVILGQGQEGTGFLHLGGSVHTATPLPQWNPNFFLHRSSPSTAVTKQVQLPAPSRPAAGRQCMTAGVGGGWDQWWEASAGAVPRFAVEGVISGACEISEELRSEKLFFFFFFQAVLQSLAST